MAFQAPWRVAGNHRRRMQIVERLDPVLRDPATPPDVRQYRREFLQRHPEVAAAACVPIPPSHVGAMVLDGGQACSDDPECNTRTEHNPFGK